MRTITVVVAVVAAVASPARAQADLHLYGGGGGTADEFTRVGLFGTGGSSGNVYVAVDGHGLWLTDEGMQAFRQLARSAGADLTLNAYGLDVSVGGVFRSSTDRVQFIPVGLVGYTRADLEACIYDSFCDEESETEINFGAGAVAAFKSAGGSGLHVGFRYTRNYGAAVTIGYIFQMARRK